MKNLQTFENFKLNEVKYTENDYYGTLSKKIPFIIKNAYKEFPEDGFSGDFNNFYFETSNLLEKINSKIKDKISKIEITLKK